MWVAVIFVAPKTLEIAYGASINQEDERQPKRLPKVEYVAQSIHLTVFFAIDCQGLRYLKVGP